MMMGAFGVVSLLRADNNHGATDRPVIDSSVVHAGGPPPVGSGEAKLVWTPVMTGGLGNPNNFLLRGLTVFQGHLYTLVANGKDGGEIYRSATGEPGSWEKVVDGGFGETANRFKVNFRSIIAWSDQLFVGTGLPRGKQGAQIWRTLDGTAWQRVADDGFGQGRQHLSVRAVASFGGYLYAGTGTEFVGSAGIYRSSTGDQWERVMADGFGKPRRNNDIYALGVFNGQLYASTFNTDGTEIYRSSDGESWELVADRGFGHPANIYTYELRVYQPTLTSPAKLVAITGGNPTGGEVWAYDGTTWVLFAPKGLGNRRNTDIWQARQFGSDFYAGTFKLAKDTFMNRGAELWRYDHNLGQWIAETKDGFGNPDNEGIRTIFAWNGALYVGTDNPTTGCELWKGTPRW
jgi:hypothetical protein